MIGAKVLLHEGLFNSVLILDLDAHCCGGTAQPIDDAPRIWHADVSVSMFDQCSYQASSALREVDRAGDYLRTVEQSLAQAEKIGPFDLCLYNAGMDPYEGCGIGGLDGITAGVLAQREQSVFDWFRQESLPVACTLARRLLFESRRMVVCRSRHHRGAASHDIDGVSGLVGQTPVNGNHEAPSFGGQRGVLHMVMGPTHAMSGAAAGLAIGAFLPLEWGGAASVTEVFVFAGVTAGAALLPDLDTPQSTLARSFGLVSKVIAHITESVSKTIYRLTMTSKDTRINNGHRTATHTLWFALLAGAGTATLVTTFGKNSAIGVLFFMLGLAIRGLAPTWTKKQDWAYVTGLSLALAVAVWFMLPASAGSAALGAAVATGVLVHLLGDMLTKRGVPLLGGVVSIGGKRWWNFRPPGPLRIRAGAGMDKMLAIACTAVTGILAYCVVAAPHLIGAPWAAATFI